MTQSVELTPGEDPSEFRVKILMDAFTAKLMNLGPILMPEMPETLIYTATLTFPASEDHPNQTYLFLD